MGRVSAVCVVAGLALAAGKVWAEAPLQLVRGGDVLDIPATGIAAAAPGADQSGAPALSVVLTGAARADLAAFTARHVGAVIEVRLCGVAVVEPRLLTPLDGGQMLVSLADGPDPAEAVRLVRGEAPCAGAGG